MNGQVLGLFALIELNTVTYTFLFNSFSELVEIFDNYPGPALVLFHTMPFASPSQGFLRSYLSTIFICSFLVQILRLFLNIYY